MRTRDIMLAATLLAGTVLPAAAQPAAIYDPRQLPATEGRVLQYSLTPRGDVDGVILQDGTQVHLPPHLGAQLVQAVKPGDAVTIHGLKAQALPLIQALSVTGGASRQTVVDAGPPPGPPPGPPQPLVYAPQWMLVQGRVREPLYGPRGDMNGALLDDGTQVHLPPDQADRLAADLQAGRMLVAQGYGVAGPYGRSVDARRIGESPGQLVEVGPPGPRGGPGRAGPGAPPPPPPPPGGLAPPPPPPG